MPSVGGAPPGDQALPCVHGEPRLRHAYASNGIELFPIQARLLQNPSKNRDDYVLRVHRHNDRVSQLSGLAPQLEVTASLGYSLEPQAFEAVRHLS